MSENPFPESSFAYLFQKEDEHWWFRARNRVILWAIGRFVGRFETLLEAGFGNGYVLSAITRAYPQAMCHGNEYFAEALRYARMRLPDALLTQEDVTTMCYSEQYDVIGLFDVLEHIPDHALALQQCHQALTTDGWLIISVPQLQWLWSRIDDYSNHQRRYSRRSLVDLLNHECYSVKYINSFVSLLLPLMIISRAMNRSDASIDSEWTISPTLNRILLAIMSLEFAMMRIGVNFPAGGSLLVVAQKRHSISHG